jgi:hypothetical protein
LLAEKSWSAGGACPDLISPQGQHNGPAIFTPHVEQGALVVQVIHFSQQGITDATSTGYDPELTSVLLPPTKLHGLFKFYQRFHNRFMLVRNIHHFSTAIGYFKQRAVTFVTNRLPLPVPDIHPRHGMRHPAR